MPQHKAARKVVTRSPQRKVGLINCRWFQDQAIEHESQLEKRFVCGSMLCQELVRIESQPFTLSFQGKRYTPDYLLSFNSGIKIVVEVKIFRRVNAYKEIFDLAEKKLNEKGFLFYVLTEREIDFAKRSKWAVEILRYAKNEYTQTELLRVLANVPEFPLSISLVDLVSKACCTAELVLHLIARRKLNLIDMDASLNGDACITKADAISSTEILSNFENRFQTRNWSISNRLVTAGEIDRHGIYSSERIKKGSLILPRYYGQTERGHPLSSISGGL